MILYVDSENKIKAVDKTTDESLTSLYVDENNESFPFKGWSTARICCYRVTVENGVITMKTPYVDSKMLDSIDAVGHQVDSISPWTKTLTASKRDTEVQFDEVPDGIAIVLVKDCEGNVIENSYSRNGDMITVVFPPLEYAADIIITIN